MEYLPVTVECHSGYKADEYPRRFTWLEKTYEILNIQDQWFQTDRDPSVPAANYFKVETSDAYVFILRHELAGDCWELVV